MKSSPLYIALLSTLALSFYSPPSYCSGEARSVAKADSLGVVGQARPLIIKNSDSFPIHLTITTATTQETFTLQPYGKRSLALVIPSDAQLTFVSKTLGTLKLQASLLRQGYEGQALLPSYALRAPRLHSIPAWQAAGRAPCFELYAIKNPHAWGQLTLAGRPCRVG